ncbi:MULTISPECIES: hypothetical protein [unclassified Roseovarius]|uniref:hypothetical protein n=1 Tax=unclassified Roseovarius TaxID=2614913 RepID=UPI00273DB0DF|nr:hypothetical protein [Roseovarius sp. MMSF_3350]
MSYELIGFAETEMAKQSVGKMPDCLSGAFLSYQFGVDSRSCDQRPLFFPDCGKLMCRNPGGSQTYWLFAGENVAHDIRGTEGDVQRLLNAIHRGFFHHGNLIRRLA